MKNSLRVLIAIDAKSPQIEKANAEIKEITKKYNKLNIHMLYVNYNLPRFLYHPLPEPIRSLLTKHVNQNKEAYTNLRQFGELLQIPPQNRHLVSGNFQRLTKKIAQQLNVDLIIGYRFSQKELFYNSNFARITLISWRNTLKIIRKLFGIKTYHKTCFLTHKSQL